MTRRWGRDPFRTGLVQAVDGAARQALATSATPGLAVALVHRGQAVWAAGYGVADRMTGQPVTAATRFQAASLSKPVAAWGVLRLVERGRIGLDEPIVGRLRRWRPPPSPLDADGVTVRRLLSHTAGLSVHGYVGQPADRPLPPIEASLAGETGDSFPVELLDAPGRGWLYSGGGYSLLQLLVEELTARPFAEYMQAQVLEPLGMTASSFRWSRTAETARPHDADGRPMPDFAFAEQAAAGLVTSAPDLARFLVAALAGPRGEPPGRGVLSPAGVRLALTAAPATEGRWGLGYGLGLLPDGDLLAYHEGANRGWRGGLALLPDRRAGIVVLANGDDGNAPVDAVVQQWLGLAAEDQHFQLPVMARAASEMREAVDLGGHAAQTRSTGPGGGPMAREQPTKQVSTFCPLCVSRCGAKATITDGAFAALHPDPSHPTGQALCVKGKAAPELVSHAERLLHPLKRTNPKGAGDPGWQRIAWDEALDTVAARLLALAREHGPESVVFGATSPSTSAMSDAIDWVMRLRRAFGSPNQLVYMELCGWGRYLAPVYTYGASVPGTYLPDLDHAGCILYWGYNPSVARLAHATATVAALVRGARLVVVDPRRAGLASKADHWLRVRPGTDAALALSLAYVMIDHGWFDADFVRRWTNGPLLVRTDTSRLLRANDLSPAGDPAHYVAWDEVGARPVAYDPASGRHAVDEARLALFGAREVATTSGPVVCRPAFDLAAQQCRRMEPAVAEAITGVPAAEIERTARTLWESRPVAFYTWSGLEQHSNTTQIVRAIDQLYALTGSLDARGGNVLFPSVPTNPIDGAELLAPEQRVKAVGVAQRPLGPARFEFVTGEDVFTAALEGRPYRVRGLVNFGANVVMAHGDSGRGRDALAALDFFVHADLFMNPTAEQADLVLPVTSAFEAEGLKIGFEINEAAQSLVQLRRPLAPPRGEARSDLQIIFALATRLGLGGQFWNGDLDAAFRHQLAPSGVTLEQLRAEPAGVRVPLTTRYRKYAELNGGAPRGFRTPSGKVELYSEALADHGYPPLPEFEEPRTSPRSRPELAERFPLILTCAKSLWFCESQHRNLASLRRRVPDPQVELHPDTARSRGVAAGDWVRLETPHGGIRARARFNASLDPQVVCGQHGWWQACAELGLPGYPPFGPGSANLNLVLGQQPSDPISGSAPLRASVCDVAPLAAVEPAPPPPTA